LIIDIFQVKTWRGVLEFHIEIGISINIIYQFIQIFEPNIRVGPLKVRTHRMC